MLSKIPHAPDVLCINQYFRRPDRPREAPQGADVANVCRALCQGRHPARFNTKDATAVQSQFISREVPKVSKSLKMMPVPTLPPPPLNYSLENPHQRFSVSSQFITTCPALYLMKPFIYNACVSCNFQDACETERQPRRCEEFRGPKRG